MSDLGGNPETGFLGSRLICILNFKEPLIATAFLPFSLFFFFFFRFFFFFFQFGFTHVTCQHCPDIKFSHKITNTKHHLVMRKFIKCKILCITMQQYSF